MKNTNKVIIGASIVAALVCGLGIGKATGKKVVVQEVEKVVNVPVEVVKTVEVEKVVEKPVVKTVEKIVEKPVKVVEYRDVPVFFSEEKNYYSEDEMTSELWDKLLANNDIFVYYVVNGEYVKRAYFRQGTKITKFERVGRYPIVYSLKELF